MLLGIDIGGTKTAVILGERDGTTHARRQMATPGDLSPEQIVDLIADVARDLLAARAGADVEAVGVSIGGPLDSETGTILGPPHLPRWQRVPLAAWLEARLDAPVYVEHDARAGALAEWWFGAGRTADGHSVSDLVFLTLGTGIGAGIISGGRLLHGRTSRTAEVGHWRVAPDGPEIFGKRGSWESYCGGAGIAALAAQRFPHRFGGTDVAGLAALARSGDVDARAIFDESARRLGEGLALLADLFAPDLVVLGALGVRVGDLLIPGAVKALHAEALPAVAERCRVVPAALGERIGDVAALCAALYRLS